MSAPEILDGLLLDIRAYLDETWEDGVRDRKLLEFIQSGMVRLDKILGAGADYTVPGQPRTMLFEYVRYARDGAMDIFENNYLHLLMAMQHERLVHVYAEESDQT